MKFWQIVLPSVLASEILAGLVVGTMGLLLNRVVTRDFMVTGAAITASIPCESGLPNNAV